jgi:hypothetical protein
VFYAIGIAQSGQVPVVIVGEVEAPFALRGPMLGDIPNENVFSQTSSGFPADFAIRLRELASTAPLHQGAGSGHNQYDVFVSYSAKDQEHAAGLSKFLRESKVSFWDYDRSRREFETDFSEEIDQAIRRSSVFLAILTPNWRPSKWAQMEFYHARKLGKPQFVLEFEDTEPILMLALHTLIDCKGSPYRGFYRMLERLDEIRDSSGQNSEPQAPHFQPDSGS